MPATIVSFAQFLESRQRRQSAVPLPSAKPTVLPEGDSPDDQPLTAAREAPLPAPRDTSPRS